MRARTTEPRVVGDRPGAAQQVAVLVTSVAVGPQVAGLWRTPVRRAGTWTQTAPVRATEDGSPPSTKAPAPPCHLLSASKFCTEAELITFSFVFHQSCFVDTKAARVLSSGVGCEWSKAEWSPVMELLMFPEG